MKNRKKKRKEEGQAMVEFALVLPIFLLLVMGILDFGFLFYNYISMENAARNAARIACVEYDDVAYNSVDKTKIVERTLTIPAENATKLATYDNMTASDGVVYSDAEKDICIKVAESLERTGIDKEGVVVSIQYTYDTSEAVASEGWNLDKRYSGDVNVTVKGYAHVLTPILGIGADHMKKELNSKSTFKVEQQYTGTTSVGG